MFSLNLELDEQTKSNLDEGWLRLIINFMNHLIFVKEAYIPNFRRLVPFLHVKKFVVVGAKVDLVLSFKPKLNKKI